jgi:hypothetical protein
LYLQPALTVAGPYDSVPPASAEVSSYLSLSILTFPMMKRLITWAGGAEVAVVHLYSLWHLVQVLFFQRGCR